MREARAQYTMWNVGVMYRTDNVHYTPMCKCGDKFCVTTFGRYYNPKPGCTGAAFIMTPVAVMRGGP